VLDSCERPALLSRSARRNYSTSRLSCAKSRGTMSLTFAQRGSMALNQFRSSSGTPIVRERVVLSENPREPVSVVVYVALRRSDTGSGTTTFIRVPRDLATRCLYIHTVDKRDS
jgi:hypothetical protein